MFFEKALDIKVEIPMIDIMENYLKKMNEYEDNFEKQFEGSNID